MIGPSGAGKSSLAATITRVFGWVRLTTGDLMRELRDDPTEVGDYVRKMAVRDLPPDGVAQWATISAMLRVPTSTGVVLDGFPRTREQAEALQIALADAGRRIVAVVAVEVDEEVSLARIARRYTCSNCRVVTSSAEPACPDCGGLTARRAHDGLMTSVLRRRARYFTDIPPVYQFYEAQGRLCRVDGTPSLAEVMDTVARHITRRLETSMTTPPAVTPTAHPEAAAALALVREPQRGIYLREALSALARLATPPEIDAILVGSTFVLAKPEAVAGRRLRRIGAFLHEQGLDVVGVIPVELDRIRTRALWNEHLDRGPLPVSQLLDLAGSAAPAVLFLVRAGTDVTAQPASGQIAKLKGRAVATPGDGSLRGRLHVTAPPLNFVHTPDDQARVFGELALLLTPSGLLEGLALLKNGPALDVAAIDKRLDVIESATPAEALDADLALTRLSVVDPPLAHLARSAVDPGADLASWHRAEVIDQIAGEDRLAVWDRVTLVAHLIGDSRITFGMVPSKTHAGCQAPLQPHTGSIPPQGAATVAVGT
jgi:adenylate kinase